MSYGFHRADKIICTYESGVQITASADFYTKKIYWAAQEKRRPYGGQPNSCGAAFPKDLNFELNGTCFRWHGGLLTAHKKDGSRVEGWSFAGPT